MIVAAEEAGFDSAWTVEHTVIPELHASQYPYSNDGRMAGDRYDLPLPDPLIWMAYVAAHTTRIKLGTGILILPQHNPVVVAKQIATLDLMSGGRILLGIGVGWMREEFDVIGASFDDRAARTDEYIAVMRTLWSQQKASFSGDFFHFENVYCLPQPPEGDVPVIVGGHSRAAARRAGRIGDGFFPARELPEDLISLARETAESNDRDPDELEITVSYPASDDGLGALAALDVDRVLVPVSRQTGMGATIRSPEEALSWKSRLEDYA
jgi:probable F420-dependent oxidoreductase